MTTDEIQIKEMEDNILWLTSRLFEFRRTRRLDNSPMRHAHEMAITREIANTAVELELFREKINEVTI